MTRITGCQIFNQVDSKYYTLYAEWFNSDFKVMLLEPTVPPLSGKMDSKDVSYFCDELSKSSDEYLRDTKRIFCGENHEIQFFIENETLQWKKNVWTLGKIGVHFVSDIQIICQSFQQLLEFYQSTLGKMNALEEENKNLKDVNKEMSSKVEKMIQIKSTMEHDLYTKFILILNSKKKKIKELENALKEKENAKESIFNVPTDESEESETDEHAMTSPKICGKGDKRKLVNTDRKESVHKNRKADCTVKNNINCKLPNSKDYVNDKVCTMHAYEPVEKRNIYGEQACSSKDKGSRSSLNLIEEESEEELFSQ